MSNPIRFKHIPDVAQYKGSDYSNAIRVERGITVEEAKAIAAADPAIDYFFIVTGGMMVLEFAPDQRHEPEKDPLKLVSGGSYRFDDDRPGKGYMRLFEHGDAVFFRKEGRWLGSAPGLADVYEKE